MSNCEVFCLSAIVSPSLQDGITVISLGTTLAIGDHGYGHHIPLGLTRVWCFLSQPAV